MANLGYDQLYAQFLELYQNEQWTETLDLLTREFDHFPDRAPDLFYLRFCMAARLGDKPQVLQLLQESLDAGIGYAESMLRESPSLQKIQGGPEFERLVELSMACLALAQKDAPSMLTLSPEGSSPLYPLALALHSNMSNPDAEVESWKGIVSQGWLLAMPQSSAVAWTGARSACFWQDHESAGDEIKAHYARLKTEYEIDPERTILGGLSMGAEVAVWLTLTGQVPARGFVVVGPGGPFINEPDNWKPLIDQAQGRGLRGVVILGKVDQAIPHDGVRALVTMLNEGGIPCELVVCPDLGHEYPSDFHARLEDALTFILE